MLGTYYKFFFCHRQLICHSVCLIERKHLQLLSRVLCVCVIISGDPLLGFVIFNVLLSGCCCCQQWRKATESLFTAFRTMIHISIVFLFFPLFPACPSVASLNKTQTDLCLVLYIVYTHTAAISVY